MSKNSQRSLKWGMVLLMVASTAGCVVEGNETSGMGSETNWLASCEEDSDCNEGSCLCGVCTITCNSNSACSDVGDDAECVSTDEIRACSEAPQHKLCGYTDTPFQANVQSEAGTPAIDAGDSTTTMTEEDAGNAVTGDEPDTTADGGSQQTTNSPASSESDGGDGTTDTTEPEPTMDPLTPMPATAPSQADVLFVVDNSSGMTDKRMYLEDAAPKYVQQLHNPPCVDESGAQEFVAGPTDECPTGFVRVFPPITDIHVGVITTSLGGYGAQLDCVQDGTNPDSAQTVDMGHLLASLPRGAAVAPDAASDGFFSWSEESDVEDLSTQLSALVHSAGVFGCGWEAPMEAWNRFLVDPYPYTKIVRTACNASDTALSCSGPETDQGNSQPLVDMTILEQRAAFLRPNSLLTIVTLGDENDCSFKPMGQTWRLTQSAQADQSGALAYYPAFRATAACSDPEMGPNDRCCHSCGQASVPEGCPLAPDAEGTPTAAGCEEGRKFTIDETGDHPNLRCFNQKQRFGVDYLLPVERYSNALTEPQICPPVYSDTLEVEGCASDPVTNPIFAGERPANWIVFGNILGAPWQDLAVSADEGDPLELRSTNASAEDSVNWDWLIGERYPADGIARPSDPLMLESVAPRSGTNPATGEELAAPSSGYMANSINGHESSVVDESDLQHACTYTVPERTCLNKSDAEALRDDGFSPPDCSCTDYSGSEFQNPLCQNEDGDYSLTQVSAGAYPSIRQLLVAYDLGDNAVIGSVCPKVAFEGDNDDDYGYRPFVRALLRRVDEVASASE
jgi:hypothetical protein